MGIKPIDAKAGQTVIFENTKKYKEGEGKDLNVTVVDNPVDANGVMHHVNPDAVRQAVDEKVGGEKNVVKGGDTGEVMHVEGVDDKDSKSEEKSEALKPVDGDAVLGKDNVMGKKMETHGVQYGMDPDAMPSQGPASGPQFPKKK